MRVTSPPSTPRSRWKPRITIERLRTLVLIGGGLLVVAIAVFLGFGQWKRLRSLSDIPGKLGIDIQERADGVDYTQSRKGKTLFKIHAAKAVQMKKDGKTLLHDVKIDLYGDDGNRTDTISGAEFQYDPGAGVAQAAGAVEITLMRPGVTPAISERKPGERKPGPARPGEQPASPKLPAIANQVTDSEIHVKTSGLTFDQKSGVATTAQRVDFALRQGTGSSIGAIYNSSKGQLVLDHAVELHVERENTQASAGPVTIHASHGEFERIGQVCTLTQARADYSGGQAQIADALIHFRDDGSVTRLDGSGGVDIQTDTGGHIAAPRGNLEFDEHNHPRRGLLEGGARLETSQPNRQTQGTAPTAHLSFDSAGQLRQAHLEQGVIFNSQQQVTTAKGAAVQLRRTWKSQVADITFASAAAKPGEKSNGPKSGQAGKQPGSQSRIEPRAIHGAGGVVITSESTGVGGPSPSRLVADTVDANLAPGSVLSTLSGAGHASFEQRTPQGVHQSSSSDQLDVRFVPVPGAPSGPDRAKSSEASEISTVVQQGHVVLIQDPPAATPNSSGNPVARQGQSSNSAQNRSPIRATAARSEYDGQTQVMQLFGNPHLQDGALDMTASHMVFSRASGDATANGDVKASWMTSASGDSPLPGATLLGGGARSANGPVHAIASVAEMHQASQEVIFRGQGSAQSGNLPRLWQGPNSVSAPVITLNRQKQTLTAVANGAANPVRTVLLSNPPSKSGKPGKPAPGGKPDGPSIIRLRSGDLHYSEGERVAFLNAASVGSVTAETTGSGGSATVVSQQAEVHLLPAGVHGPPARPGSQASTASPANASVDSLTARGHVTVDWPGRKGTGEKLVYLSEDATYTLTGTSSAPPRITDQARGAVTGSALIFHGRDDSVTVEGDGGKTVTETQSPK